MNQEFDNYAEDYEKILNDLLEPTGLDYFYFVRAKAKKLRHLFPSLSNKPINFLDYGCGMGSLCEELPKVFPEVNYFGIEAADAMVQLARSKYQQMGTFEGTHSTEWKTRSYDIIFAAGVFHHIPHKEHYKVVANLKTLLSVSGSIVIWEHNPNNPVTRAMVRNCILDKNAVLIPPRTMKNLLVETGLFPVKTLYTSFFPGFLKFLAPMEILLEWFPLGGHYVTIGGNSP